MTQSPMILAQRGIIPRWKITRTRDKNWLVTRFGVARAVFTTWADAYDYAARKAAQGEL